MAMAPCSITGEMQSVPEFPLVLHLLNPKMLRQASVQLLLELESNLTSARFDKFWKTMQAEDSIALVKPVHGFADAMQRYIAFAISRTYSSIRIADACKALGVEDLAEIARVHGWTLERDVATIPLNEGNSPSARRREDGVKVSAALAALSATSSVL